VIALFTAGGVALLLTGLGTPVLMRWLTARGVGQHIREDGPKGHVTKAGTPTMGGITIVGAVVIGYIAGHLGIGAPFTRSGALVILVVAAAGLVGLIDDWIKVHNQRNLGLSSRAKLGGQLLLALTFVFLGLYWVKVSTMLSFTRYSSTGINLHYAGWGILAAVALIGASNAVNLTDGLDGLAAGSASIIFSCLAVIGYWVFRHPRIYHVHNGLDLALVAVALTGACTGFLWWNAAPARIFMGDTGSLAIGAGLAALCFEMNLQLLLPLLGGLFVLVTLSVVIQVASFRLFGRRVFLMAPLHHHFELKGWPETTVIIRFWILAGLFTAMSLGLFYADFLTFGTAG